MSDHLDDLLLYWEECYDRGMVVSAAELCPGASGDAAELERRIQLCLAVKALLSTAEGGPAPPPAPDPGPGRIGKYEIRQLLGRGPASRVYLAWDPDLQRAVAVKVLTPPHLASASALARRFQREAQVLAQLKHEYIVPIFEANLQNGVPYFVMEYVSAGSLGDAKESLTAAGPGAVVPLVEKVARAVQYSHARGVLHRDLKPGNIFLGAAGNPLVGDFGLAKLLHNLEPEPPPALGGATPLPADTQSLTVPGDQPGTLPYMAPEQLDSTRGAVGPATDIWALGVLLYELLTGRKPFPGKTRDELAGQVCRCDPPRPGDLCPHVDRGLERIVFRCLAKDPGRRYPSAEALAKALAAWQRPSRRRAWRVATVLVPVVAVAGLVLAALIPWQPTFPDEEARYRVKASSLLADLKRTGKVTLVREDGLKPVTYWVRSGPQGTVVGETRDGLRIHAAERCGLVELLPDIPHADYRVTTTFRLERPLTVGGECGLYARHGTAATQAQGQQHNFTALFFAGFRSRTEPQQVTPGLRHRWFCRLRSPPEDLLFRDARDGNNPVRNMKSFTIPPVRDNPWITVTLNVQGEVTSGRFRVGDEEWVEAPPISAQDRQNWAVMMNHSYPDTRELPWERFTGTAMGIYVREGLCLVRDFIVETGPDKPQGHP